MNLTDALQMHDDSPLSVADENQLERHARDRIRAWWERAGLEPSYPANDSTAAALARAVEFDIDAERLVRFCDVAAFGGVAFTAGRRVWRAMDIARLGLFLESRRDWQSHSSLHDAKKHPLEIVFDNSRESGDEHAVFFDLERFDLKSLLLLLVEAGNRQQREILRIAIRTKLASFHIDA